MNGPGSPFWKLLPPLCASALAEALVPKAAGGPAEERGHLCASGLVVVTSGTGLKSAPQIRQRDLFPSLQKMQDGFRF